MTVGSLFAGIGGFDLAFERAGFDVRWQVESDRQAQAVLKARFPGVTLFDDVRTVSVTRNKRERLCLDDAKAGLDNARGMGEPMAVGAKDDAVVQGECSTLTLTDEMMRIGSSFVPVAPHARGAVEPNESLSPSAFVGVNAALGDQVRAPFVPSDPILRNREACCDGANGTSAVVSGEEVSRAPSFVEGCNLDATSTGTVDPLHEKSISHYLVWVDVICAGFPCQDVSVAGKRAGLDGTRTGLFWEAIRIIREMQEASAGEFPRFVVLENVPGLLSSKRGRDFHTVVSALAELGFDLEWRILDSRYFGVAQRRRRVFLVCRARGYGDGAEAVLFEPEGGGRDSAAGDEARADVANSLTPGSGRVGSRGADDGVNIVVGTLVHALSAAKSGQRFDPNGEDYVIATLQGGGHSGEPAGVGVGREGDPAFTVSERQQGVAGAGGVRRLTPLECERLQGFPDGWTCLCGAGHRGSQFCRCPDSPRYRQLGNAVTVNVAEWIARRLAWIEQALEGL